jgi:hypothetical protein
MASGIVWTRRAKPISRGEKFVFIKLVTWAASICKQDRGNIRQMTYVYLL